MIVRAIANSFASDEPLRDTFLNAQSVRRLLVDAPVMNAHAAATGAKNAN